MTSETPPTPNGTPNATLCATAQIGVDSAYGAVIPPLYLSSTYKFEGLGKIGAYDYGRGGNPNRDGLAQAVAQMEGGADGVVTASGMAAIDLVLNLLAPEQLVIAPHDCYGGTQRLLNARQQQGRLRVQFIDQSDAAAIANALGQNPAMVLVETPSNPLMRLVDIARLADAAHGVGALLVCDNTFLSPARQRPLTLGADLVVHSATKFLNGHSDVVGGIAIAKTKECAKRLSWWANCTGTTGAPFDSYLILRGLRTLHARMDVQEANATKIAHFLEAHPRVSAVHYPGLPSCTGFAIAKKQQSGPGAVLSFTLNTNRDGLGAFLANTGLFQLAESLGGTESLICHPASMTHRAMDQDAQARAGIGSTLLRLSVGLERNEDQVSALKTMFAAL